MKYVFFFQSFDTWQSYTPFGLVRCTQYLILKIYTFSRTTLDYLMTWNTFSALYANSKYSHFLSENECLYLYAEPWCWFMVITLRSFRHNVWLSSFPKNLKHNKILKKLLHGLNALNKQPLDNGQSGLPKEIIYHSLSIWYKQKVIY